VLALLLLAILPRAVCAAEHEVWLLSTRGLSECGASAIDGIRYWRLADGCRWAPAQAAEFHAGDNLATPTVVYIHGNDTDADEAVSAGCCVDQIIQSAACGAPFRFVIWSWPSDRVCRRIRSDIQLKADRSDVEAYWLALWLDQLRPGVRVGLAGHSFGPRIIAGAGQLLAGGELSGRCLPPQTVAAWTGKKPKNRLRAVLLASATDLDSLAPGGQNELALTVLEEVLITCNDCDRALRWYPRLYGRGGPEALGFAGPCGLGGPGKVAVLDVSDTVGRTHDWQVYCCSPELACRWAHYAFLDAPPETAGK
jgi:hypothetical protein